MNLLVRVRRRRESGNRHKNYFLGGTILSLSCIVLVLVAVMALAAVCLP